MGPVNLGGSITTLPGVGESTAGKLARLGISTIFDLLYHLPFRYEDRRNIKKTIEVMAGETVSLIVKVEKIKNDFTRHGKIIQNAIVSDSTGPITVVWFNQPFLYRALKPGTQVALFGRVDNFIGKLALISPEYEIISAARGEDLSSLIHTGRLVPVYPETAGVSSKWLRTKVFSLLNRLDIDDFLPDNFGLPPWKKSLWTAHFPENETELSSARHRLAFDEFLLLQITNLLRRKSWKTTKLSFAFSVDQDRVAQFISSLPFTLTSTQTGAIREILADLSRSQAMNRLLEGDVGSGKTVVAATAAFVAHQNGLQTLFLTPTQILASQHFDTLSALFKPFGISVGLISGVTSAKAKTENSKLNVIVGTHAVLTKNLAVDKVGLVVIDEQHRFGVIQRGLAAAKGSSPHILTMTATPIPRTIALTMYGDLELSVLDAPPSGRLPVKTWVTPENKREAAYAWIKQQLTTNNLQPTTNLSGLPAGQTGLPAGRQAFIVCPFIEESESAATVKAATVEFTKLQHVFSGFKLGLLHGKLKAGEKLDVIDTFRSGKLDVLVTTPVVEVGIDVPGATIMVIEGGERFGLAQLHQLRGRVGRSTAQSYCILFTDQPSERLKSLETHHSGRELAEIDLQLRGPGEVFGTSQHGLPQFKVATYQDFGLIGQAKAAAESLVQNISRYPNLRSLINNSKISLVQPN